MVEAKETRKNNGQKIEKSITFLKPQPVIVKPLSANPTKWSKTIKEFIGSCGRIV